MGWTIVIVIVAFAAIVGGWVISTGNHLERQRVKIQEADSGIDVALAKRYDTLTKLFDVAKGYMKHEQEILLEAVRLRTHMPVTEKLQAEQQMDEAYRQIRIAAEAYPDLASKSLFVELQRAVVDTEEHLQAARRLYNANVSALNQLAVSFPSSIVAGIKGIHAQPMFVAQALKQADVNLKM